MDEWFYMSGEERSAADLKTAAESIPAIITDLWNEANVLELTLEDGGVIDFEPMKPFFKDKEDDAFLKANGIKTLFAVTAEGSAQARIRNVFSKITEHAGGFFCADTPDFLPVVGKDIIDEERKKIL